MGNCVQSRKTKTRTSDFLWQREMLRYIGTPIVWIYGGPGIGKRTQTEMVVDTYGFISLNTSDMLRMEAKELSARGIAVSTHFARREPVPPRIIVDMLRDSLLSHMKLATGFVICDFPMDLESGKLFEKEICKASRILYLKGSTRTMLERSLEKIRTEKILLKLQDHIERKERSMPSNVLSSSIHHESRPFLSSKHTKLSSTVPFTPYSSAPNSVVIVTSDRHLSPSIMHKKSTNDTEIYSKPSISSQISKASSTYSQRMSSKTSEKTFQNYDNGSPSISDSRKYSKGSNPKDSLIVVSKTRKMLKHKITEKPNPETKTPSMQTERPKNRKSRTQPPDPSDHQITKSLQKRKEKDVMQPTAPNRLGVAELPEESESGETKWSKSDKKKVEHLSKNDKDSDSKILTQKKHSTKQFRRENTKAKEVNTSPIEDTKDNLKSDNLNPKKEKRLRGGGDTTNNKDITKGNDKTSKTSKPDSKLTRKKLKEGKSPNKLNKNIDESNTQKSQSTNSFTKETQNVDLNAQSPPLLTDPPHESTSSDQETANKEQAYQNNNQNPIRNSPSKSTDEIIISIDEATSKLLSVDADLERQIQYFYSTNAAVLKHFNNNIIQINAERTPIAVFESIKHTINEMCSEMGLSKLVAPLSLLHIEK